MAPGQGKGNLLPDKVNTSTRQDWRRLYGWMPRLTSAAFLAGWMSFIFRLSSTPPSDLPSQLEAFAWLGKLRDVAGHLVLFGVLGIVSMIVTWLWIAESNRQARWAFIAAGLGVLYGGLDEYHQSFVPGRQASAFDVLVDSVGVALGVMGVRCLVAAAVRWRERRSR